MKNFLFAMKNFLLGLIVMLAITHCVKYNEAQTLGCDYDARPYLAPSVICE